MKKTSVRPADDVERIVNEYGDMLYRLCILQLRSAADAEDALQEVFIKYCLKAPMFASCEHEKAWLLRVAANQCRDQLRFRVRHPQMDEDTLQKIRAESSDADILEALCALPEKFRLVLVLYYIEGYRMEEIAPIIGRTPSAVKMRLQKGRKLLENIYREG